MKTLSKAKIAEVVELLGTVYDGQGSALDYRNAWELLVSVALSAQTTDIAVNKVTPELFAKYPTPQDLAKAEPKDIEGIIRTIGFFRVKSKNIVEMAKKLVTDFGGEVPQDMDALTTLPGVGRKTANVVLAFAFGEERMPVDTHVFRVANRIGMCCEKTPEKTELALLKVIPKGKISATHHYLIWHGRRICHARKPDCKDCGVKNLCLNPIL